METTLTFDVAVFDPTKEELQLIAQEVANITADPTKITKEELELVNSTKNKLVKARTRIQQIGKEKRADALKFQKDVIAYENELIAIIEPEEKRLKEIETAAKEYATKQERLSTLPDFKLQLASIGDVVEITDDELLEMDPTQRQSYYNTRLGAHLEAKQAQAKLEEEAARIKKEEEEKAAKAETEKIELQKEQIKKDKLNLRIQRLLSIGFKDMGTQYVYDENLSFDKVGLEESTSDEYFDGYINNSIQYIEKDKAAKAAKAEEEKQAAIKAAEEKARLEAEAKAKQEADEKEEKRLADEAAEKAEKEAKEAKEKAEQESRLKAEEFEKFLQSHGWTKETANEFQTSYDNTTQVTTLYRKIGEYKHN